MKQVLVFESGEQEFSKTFELNGVMSGSPTMFSDLNLDSGIYVWGYANVTTPDSTGDKFTAEALTEMAKTLTIAPYNKIFLHHDYKTIPVGIIKGTRMDDKGLLIVAKINEAHEKAEEVAKSIENKSLDGFSIAGSILEMRSDFDKNGNMINLINKATAREVTLTGIPAHPEALVQGIFRKSLEKANKELTDNYINNKPYNKDMEETKPEENNSSEVTETPTVETSEVETPTETTEEKTEEVEEVKEVAEEKEVVEDIKEEVNEVKEPVVEQASLSLQETVDKLTSEKKALEEENNELKTKLGQFEKAFKKGYEKALSENEQKPYRKSVKNIEEPKASNSPATMIQWLQAR